MPAPGATATATFVRPVRTVAPALTAGEITVAAPPQPPLPVRGQVLTRALPIVMAAAMIPMMAVAYRSGSTALRNPVSLALPLMMLVSVAVSAVAGWGRRSGADLTADRDDYLDYLAGLRRAVVDTAAAQQRSLTWCHPHPEALWTLAGGPRMWERQPGDDDFGSVRVGAGTALLATRLVAPQAGPGARVDPVTDAALRRFLHTHSSVPDVPVTIPLLESGMLVMDGDPDAARGLLRAMICQLAVLHGPDLLAIAAVATEHSREHWDWLKWLPHHQHPLAADHAGPARMAYPHPDAARSGLTGLSPGRRVLVIIDGTERLDLDGLPPGMTVIDVRSGDACPAAEGSRRLRVSATALTVAPGDEQAPVRPDRLEITDAVVCARRLAGYRCGTPAAGASPGAVTPWLQLTGIGDTAEFDPVRRWGVIRPAQRLRVPIGTDEPGRVVHLDIKEAAEGGAGPHGLCIGATGSGKSELLRTIALGMMAGHSPEELNLVLIDFKGGATFLGMEQSRHVAAVITNLADEAPLVARMHDALAGELTRRQELLRSAGNFVGAAAYRAARRSGAPLAPLPTLFVIVDEFSELLGQHPDFADMFVTIGRLGRSLGVHLLLASQRLDEGRLRGLESHLSYRVCLKTLSAGESRAVLGVPDAHQLPGTPGMGYLCSPAGELTRFQATFVSGPCPRPASGGDDTPPVVRLFTAAPTGTVVSPANEAGTGPTVLQAVLDRLAGHGTRARQVWLSPLDASPSLAGLLGEWPPAPDLTVPIGIVDRPFEQRRAPLEVNLRGATGNAAVVGAPQSGKSTALTTLVAALSATHDRVRFYCLDFGGGTLGSLRSLPQVGSVAGRGEPDLVRRTVSEMEAIIARREPVGGTARFDDVFLVIDGWADLCRQFDALEAPITALAARGLSFGVHLVLSASRWAEIRPALRDQIGTRIELRLGDPADSELDRRRAQDVPRGRPGRGLTGDGLHMLIALPGPGGPGGLEDCIRCDAATAPPIPLLPARVDRHTLAEAAGAQPLLGVEERGLHTVTLDFARQQHLLVFGDSESGKTSVLRLLCRELLRTGADADLVVVDYRRGLLGVVEPSHRHGYALSAAALSALMPDLLSRLAGRMAGPDVSRQQLRDRSWWSGPEIYLLVDDYDLVAAVTGNPLTPLLEYLPHAADLGLHLVIARRSGGANRAVYEPVLAMLRELGCMGLIMSGNPEEGPLVGSARPVPLPPGRGTLVTRRDEQQLIQVAWSCPA